MVYMQPIILWHFHTLFLVFLSCGHTLTTKKILQMACSPTERCFYISNLQSYCNVNGWNTNVTHSKCKSYKKQQAMVEKSTWNQLNVTQLDMTHCVLGVFKCIFCCVHTYIQIQHWHTTGACPVSVMHKLNQRMLTSSEIISDVVVISPTYLIKPLGNQN